MSEVQHADGPVPVLLTIQEVAERLRVNQKTIRRWIESKHLSAFKLGRQWRIDERDLRRFLQARWNG